MHTFAVVSIMPMHRPIVANAIDKATPLLVNVTASSENVMPNTERSKITCALAYLQETYFLKMSQVLSDK